MKHRYQERPGIIWIFALVALLLAWRVCYGILAYDDWTCGFKTCVEVK